ncbi:hypothetical protein QYF36_024925 [Acer negundo]|nr:hypothetical protein QYF36_003622 [Acer negundo]KAK4841070.1 hypothetical protein QYF36_024925 [Acer negundo]
MREETAEEGSLVKMNGCMGVDRGSLNVPVINISGEVGKYGQMIVPYFEIHAVRSREEKMDIEFHSILVGQLKEKRSKDETWAKKNTFSVDNDIEILKYLDNSPAVIDDDILKSQAISSTTLVKFEKAALGCVAAGFKAGKQRDNEKDEGHLVNSKKN